MNTIYCANDPCKAEAVMLVEETNTPLCRTCANAYKWGQASPHKHLSHITNDTPATNPYYALRTSLGLSVFRPDGSELPLRLDLYNHSPTGFECGYGGSGPAQLALALLADAFGDQVALAHYQNLHSKVIAPLPRDKGWSLTVDQIRAALPPSL